MMKRLPKKISRPLNIFLGTLTLVLLFLLALPRNPSGLKRAPENAALQTAHGLALAMFQYSIDNDGNYPDGKSSTEVFQKLIPTYISNPAILYLPLRGKTKWVGGPLKPENICWDVTGGVNSNDPDDLPLLFMTGYSVRYVSGCAAVPLIKPFPPYEPLRQTWLDWFRPDSDFESLSPGIIVSYKDMSSRFLALVGPINSETTIPNFIPTTFNLHGKSYRQLTPDGTLP